MAGLLGCDIPRRTGHLNPSDDPAAPAYDDHPADYGMGRLRFTLRRVPIGPLMPWEPDCPGGRHGAHCYAAARFEEPGHHDVGQPEFAGDGTLAYEDADYVRRLAAHPEQLPPLVVTASGCTFGGGHRLAAWRDAGWGHVPAWVPD